MPVEEEWECPICERALTSPDVCPTCGSLEGLDELHSDDEFFSGPPQAAARPAGEDSPMADTQFTGRRRVVFVDIDGVLNTTQSGPEVLEPEKIALLIALLQRSEAVVVLSSTWRVHERLRQKFQQTLLLAGSNPSMEGTPINNWDTYGQATGADAVLERCSEIEAWLKSNESRVESWVALDDLPLAALRPSLFNGRHVQTDADLGITEAGIAEALQILSISSAR